MGHELRSGALFVSRQVTLDGEVVGMVTIESDLSSLREQAAMSGLMVALVLFFTCALSFVLASRFDVHVDRGSSGAARASQEEPESPSTQPVAATRRMLLVEDNAVNQVLRWACSLAADTTSPSSAMGATRWSGWRAMPSTWR